MCQFYRKKGKKKCQRHSVPYGAIHEGRRGNKFINVTNSSTKLFRYRKRPWNLPTLFRAVGEKENLTQTYINLFVYQVTGCRGDKGNLLNFDVCLKIFILKNPSYFVNTFCRFTFLLDFFLIWSINLLFDFDFHSVFSGSYSSVDIYQCWMPFMALNDLSLNSDFMFMSIAL